MSLTEAPLKEIPRRPALRLPELHLFPLRLDPLVAWIGFCHEDIAWLSFGEASTSEAEAYWPGKVEHHPEPSSQADDQPLAAFLSKPPDRGICVVGTPFQLSVWRLLLDIPFGKTCTYQSIAARLDKPRHARAVGNAVGRNPISGLVPCHRVLPASGKSGHYRWGPATKQAILGIEQAG